MEKKKLNTVNSLIKHNDEWENSGKKRKNLKYFNNVEFKPLLTCNPDIPIHEVMNIPGLHLILGITDKILQGFETMAFETKEKGVSEVNKFLNSINLSRVVYQGQHRLEGNGCIKLLENVDKLERIVSDMSGFRYIQAFRSFKVCIDSCFGKELKPDYKEAIQTFCKDYKDLGLSVTVKVHILQCHVADFSEFKGGEYGKKEKCLDF